MLGVEILEAFQTATENIRAVKAGLKARRYVTYCEMLDEALMKIEQIRNEIRMH